MIRNPAPPRARAVAALAASCLLAAACAPRPAGHPDPAAATAEAPPPAPAGPPWATFTDGVSGISVAMPGKPKVTRFVIEGPTALDARTLALADGNPATPDYEVTRFAAIDRTMTLTLDRTADALAATWKRIDRNEKRTRGGVSTLELEGIFLDGPAVMSITAAGGWIYSATVRSASGLDREAVERFFDSVRIELPWRIEVFADEALTFALPASAAALPDQDAEGVQTRLFSVSAPLDLTFSVAWFGVADDRLAAASPAEIIDDGIAALGQEEGTRVEKVHTIEHHGLPGRELTYVADDGSKARSRMFLLGHRGYLFSIIAKDAESLDDATAARFLDSFRLGAVP